MQIPENWKVQELGLECELITKGTTPTSYGFAYQETGINFIKAESIDHNGKFLPAMFDHISEEANDAQKRSILKENDLLFSIAGALGKVAIVDKTILPANTNQALAIIRLKKNSPLNVHYLFYFLNSQELQDHIAKINVQLAQANLSLGDVNKFKIVFPPLIEQTKIATILSKIDQAIEQTEQIIAKYQRIKTGLMQDLLTRGIDEYGNIRSEETHEFKDSPFGRIPKEWEIKQCYEVCREIVVGIVIKPAQYYVEEGIPLLRSLNILENKINFSEFKYISTENNLLNKKSMLRKGDVLTVRTGYPGTTSIIPEELIGANCVDLLISRPLDVIIPEYYSLWINSSFGKKQISNMQGGLAQQHFNVTELKKLLIAFPVVKEQKKIVVKMKIIDRKIEDEQTYLTKLQKIKTGLMQDLLTGKVRVNYKD